MKSQLIAAAFAVFVTLSIAQNVCEPLDNGPFLGTQPTLEFFVTEPRDTDTLSSDCSTDEKFRSALRVSGSPGTFTLTVGAYPWMNPMDYFSVVSCGANNYLQLTQAIDRDGPTSSVEDDVTAIFSTLTCTPNNGSPAVVYDARFFILDVNDNMPMLEQNIQLQISEATDVGTVVMTVVADDLDANLDDNITYSLGSLQDQFSVDAVSGELTLTKALDYETMGSNKNLEVVIFAEDGGPDMKHTATATVHLQVQDSDDLGPAFIYDGCFTHGGVCAWPKYITGLVHKKDEPIVVIPVPNKVLGPVEIEAYDRDMAIGSEIVFSIASTIPPGHENEFRVETQRLAVGNRYKATVIPVRDISVDEGFEIFLKAEEKTVNKKQEVAMIFFKDTASSGDSTGAQGSGDNSDSDDSGYSDREVALIVVTAILATLVLCLGIALFVCFRRSSNRKGGADLHMGVTNNGFSS